MLRRARLLAAWTALCLMLCNARGAYAQQRAAAPPAYERLVDEALREYRAQHLERALALFEEAYETWPNARCLRGLGRVAYDLGYYRAATEYLQAAQISTVRPLDAALRKETLELEAAARSAIAHVTVELAPTSAEVRIDGKISRLQEDHSLQLDPGTYQVEASATGYLSARHTYQLQIAGRAIWRIHLQPIVETSTSSTPPRAQLPADAGEEALPPWRMTTGLVFTAAGAALSGYAGASLLGYLDQGDRLRANDTPANREHWNSARSDTLVLSTISASLLSVGAVALADAIPRRERSWLAPVLLTAGSAALIVGLGLSVANGCSSSQLARCSAGIEARDVGALLAMLSGPLLAIPASYAVEWLIQQ